MSSRFLGLTLLPVLGLSACAAAPPDPTAHTQSNLDGVLAYRIEGSTALFCDGGPLCTLRGSIRGVDRDGAPSRDFAAYLAGREGYVDPYHAVSCELTFGDGAVPVGRGYLDSPNGCGLPVAAGGGFTGDFDFAYSLSRDELARLLLHNATLSATSWNGTSKFHVSFAFTPSFVVRSATGYDDANPTGRGTDLGEDAYQFSFERDIEGDVAFRVKRVSDGGGRWVSLVNAPEGTDYEATAERGLALYGASTTDGIGYAAKVPASVFVDRALDESYWKLRIELLERGDFAQVVAEPHLDAAPAALGYQGGREAYSHDPSDPTGLSDCAPASGELGSWTCHLVVRE